jgi:hypothetical protein
LALALRVPTPVPPTRFGIVGEDGAMGEDFYIGTCGANDTDLAEEAATRAAEPGQWCGLGGSCSASRV